MISYKNMQAFVEVAQCSTFADAAKKLFISQPALSSSIKNMESQLGGKLFNRSTRRLELTPEGKLFLPKAQRILADYDGAIDDLKALFTAQKGSLVVSAMPSFAEGPLSEIMRRFSQNFPNISIRVLDVVMEQAIDNVLQGRAELGFVFAPQLTQGLVFTPLMKDKFCAIMPVDHPLASGISCDLKMLSKYPFVAMNRESSIRKWLDEAMLHAQLKFDTVAEASQLGTIGQLVVNKIGVAIVPQLCQPQMQKKGLVCLPIQDLSMHKEIGVLHKDSGNLSIAAKALLGLLAQFPL